MTAFYKLSGAGNDFLALVEPEKPPRAREIRAWCRRALSLGADGLFTLERARDDIRMVHYNPDGGRSELCLNGSRCAARLGFHLGWKKGVMHLETDAGRLRARDLGAGRVRLRLPPFVTPPIPRSPCHEGVAHRGFHLTVGVPHFVLPWQGSLEQAPVTALGKALRGHPDLGRDGANISFVRYTSRKRFEIRTFERGVEAETLACGTGVVAAAATGRQIETLDERAQALTGGGFELEVTRHGDESSPLYSLAGDARVVARGELLPEASDLPAPAAWSL